MAVKLHRCGAQWVKLKSHPCWKVETALIDMGIEYERVPGPNRPKSRRTLLKQGTGDDKYPAIEFEDGTWYREESKDMAAAIRAGKLDEKRG